MDSSVLTKENFSEYTGKTEGNHWNFTRFNPKHFQHIEKCILRLRDMGIEADLIVMHPYDRWGFAQMTKEQDALYWKYVLARFSAYRNMWWSLANEYDLFDHKAVEDWEGYAKIICGKDHIIICVLFITVLHFMTTIVHGLLIVVFRDRIYTNLQNW